MCKRLYRGGLLMTVASVLVLSAPQGSAAPPPDEAAMTGCLEESDGNFSLNGKRLVNRGDLDFTQHKGHTVKVTGEERGNRFRATALEHISPTCDGSPASSAATPANAADRADSAERSSAARQPTASDQGNSEADVELTAKIRKAIVEDDNLSTTAHNVTIITRDGKVTLRGNVRSMEEKTAVAAKAEAAAGASVDNQLTVKADSN